jgi:phosphogluconate dehydratase
MLAKVKTGDQIRFDAKKGEITLLVDEAELKERAIQMPDLSANMHGFGRELFVSVRQNVGSAEEGASLFDISGKERA